MTAGTRRNGSSKFGPFRRAVGGPATQEYAASAWEDEYAGHPSAADPDASAEHAAAVEPQLRQKAERYTGRHASPRGKAARKRRAGKVVPAVAVAAAVAAGTTAAAYALSSGGQPQAAELNGITMRSGATAAASTPAAGQVNAADSALVKVAQATASHGTAHAAAKQPAQPAPSRTPAVTPSAAITAKAAATPSARATTQPTATTAPASKQAAASALSCNLNYSKLPANVTAIVSFLLANGYSHNAAAGIAGNIYQESKGNPESEGMGGGGLIGWTPLPSGFVTGDTVADLETQLKALLDYNEGWSQYVPALNAASTPSSAAYIYVTDFERAGIPAAATREASAENVARACAL